MSAFDYATESGRWPSEMVPGAGHYWRWDVTQSKMLNGVFGGTWNPTSPIIIGGSGVELFGSGNAIVGGVRTQLGGRIQLSGPDVPQLFPGRTITRTMALVSRGPGRVLYTAGTITSIGNVPNITLPPALYDLGLTPQQPGVVAACLQPTGFLQGIPVPSDYLVATGQLSSVTLNFRVTQPGAVPANPPIMGPVPMRTASGSPTSFLTLSQTGRVAPWRRLTTYSVNQYTTPVTLFDRESYFRCVSSTGPSGGTEPAWNLTPGTGTTDGGAIWECIGTTGRLLPRSADDYYRQGLPQSLTTMLDTQVLTQTVDVANGGLLVQLFNWPPDGSIQFHSLVFTFTGLLNWVWF